MTAYMLANLILIALMAIPQCPPPPGANIGDKVRVLPTPQMVKEGLAGRIGTVFSWNEQYAIRLTTGLFVIPGSDLEKVIEPNIRR